MNYEKNYYDYLNYIKNRTLPNDTIVEIHHIVPRSLGGSDESNNLIKLTLREHYLAHYLLWKFTNTNKMMIAFFLMNNLSKYNSAINSRIYEKLRKEASTCIINETTGEIFMSVQEAALKYGISTPRISDVLTGNQKTTHGFVFKYIGERKFKDYNFKRKKILNKTTGEIFNSMNEAAFKYNTDRSTISKVCRKMRHKCAGCEWEYYIEKE